MSLLRIPRTAQVTLSHTFYVDETATAPTGTLTATVKRLDGTSVAGSPFTYTVTGTTCSFALPGQANLDTLTVDWAGTVAGAVVTFRDIVEIVGGFYFGLKQVRDEFTLSPTTYPTAVLADRRVEVEQECDRICGQAWVPRFARYLVDGTGTDELPVPDMMLRTCRAASTAPYAGAGFTAFTAGQLSAVAAAPSGVLIRTDGGIWPYGRSNVIVEVEHGADSCPAEITSAAMRRLRSKLGAPKSNVPDRAISYTVADGGVYRLTTPGPRSTGIPDVDAAYQGGGHERVWIA
jgi:hypothetical protein